MALSISGTGPAAWSSNITAGTGTSASFTAPSGALLVLFIETNSFEYPSQLTMSVSDSGGLTWTLQVSQQANATLTTEGGHVFIYTAVTTSAVSRTVSYDRGPDTSAFAFDVAAQIVVFEGQNTANPIGTTASGVSTTNSITPTLTTTAANSWVVGCAVDWTAAGAPSTSDTSIGTYHNAGQISAISARKSAASGGSGSSVGINFDGAGTGAVDWHYALLEILEEPEPSSLIPAQPVGYRTSVAVRSFTPYWWGEHRKQSDRQGALNPSVTPAAFPLVPDTSAKSRRTARTARTARTYYARRSRDAILDILTGGGTTTPLAVDGTITPSGAKVRQVNKAHAGTVTPVGVIVKALSRSLAGTVTPSGVPAKQINKPLSGTVTPSGTLAAIKIALLALAGTVTPSGALIKQVNDALSATVTPVGVIVKQVSKIPAGSVTPTGVLAKLIAKPLSGSVTPSGVLANVRVLLRAFAGSVTPSGALARQAQKSLTGGSTPTGAVRKQVAQTLNGSVTATGALAKRVGKILAGAIIAVGTLIAVIVGAAIPTPIKARRVWIIPADDRTVIPDTDRAWMLETDSRQWAISTNNRTWVIVPTAQELEARL